MQKWSDHAPVVLDLKDMPEHDMQRLPRACGLSSRGARLNDLKSLFQRSRQPDSCTAKQVDSTAFAAVSCLAIWPSRWPRLRCLLSHPLMIHQPQPA